MLAVGVAACGMPSVDGEPILYSYRVTDGQCADTYDVVNTMVTTRVDASTPDGAYYYRMHRINQHRRLPGNFYKIFLLSNHRLLYFSPSCAPSV